MKKVLVFLLSIAFPVSVSAIPARPGQWQVLKLKDGTQVKAELTGDEFGHFWQAANGDCYVASSEKGVFERGDRQKIVRQASCLRETRRQHMASLRTRAAIGGQHDPYTGKKKGLILLVDFQNMQFQDDHTWDLYNDIANKIGFSSELGFKGSVKDYFLQQSDGLFELDFDVVGPLTMPRTYGYYGADTGGQGNDTNPGLMVATACEMADEHVNFADYDWDGDGEVDQVFVVFAGLGQAAGGDANTIWPHEWALQYSDYGNTLKLDGVTIDTYACGPELTERDTIRSNIGIEGIGTICHEFSHCLGLPDMYDTAYGGGYGMQTWDIMAHGSYNSGSFSPAAFTSYERMYCGWRQPIVLKDDTEVSGMKAVDEGGDTYIIYNDACPTEYYLLENRQKRGWDAGVAGSGLLVIHVDYDELAWRYNFVNNFTSYPEYSNHERCTVICADNNRGAGDIGTDVYPYNDKDSLTNNSLPRAELYNLNPDGLHYTSKPVTNIRQSEEGLVSFTFRNLVRNKDNPDGILPVREMEDAARQPVYDLQGRSIGTDTDILPKGIYIIGGKKVIK